MTISQSGQARLAGDKKTPRLRGAMQFDAEHTIALLQQQGQLDSSGSFTLDVRAAQHKYRRYLTSQRHAYLTRLARAAVVAGAEYLHCQEARGQLLIHSPALLCEFDDLQHLLEQAVQSQALAQAVLLATELEPLELELTLANGERAFSLLMKSGASQWKSQAGSELRGTYLRLRFADGKGLAHRPEVAFLRQAMAYCAMPIYLGRTLLQVDVSPAPSPGPLQVARDDQLVGFRRAGEKGNSSFFWCDHQVLQWRLRDTVEGQNGMGLLTPTAASIVLQEGVVEKYQPGLLPCCGVLALYCGKTQGRLRLVHSGETLQETAMSGFLSTLEAVVDASHLPLDLTGEKVLAGEGYDHLLTWVKSREKSLREFLQARYPQVRDGDYRASLLFDQKFHGQHAFNP